MFNFIGKFSVSKVARSKVMGLALVVFFLSPNLVFSAPIPEKDKKCDQVLDQAVSNNDNNIYLEVLKCELEEANAAFAAAGGAALGTVANLNQPSITGGDITLNPPSNPDVVPPVGPLVIDGIPAANVVGRTISGGIPAAPVATEPIPRVVSGTPPVGPVANSPTIVRGIPVAPVATEPIVISDIPAVTPAIPIVQSPNEIPAVTPAIPIIQSPNEIPAVNPAIPIVQSPNEIPAVNPLGTIFLSPNEIPAVNLVGTTISGGISAGPVGLAPIEISGGIPAGPVGLALTSVTAVDAIIPDAQ